LNFPARGRVPLGFTFYHRDDNALLEMGVEEEGKGIRVNARVQSEILSLGNINVF